MLSLSLSLAKLSPSLFFHNKYDVIQTKHRSLLPFNHPCNGLDLDLSASFRLVFWLQTGWLPRESFPD